ncbi:MULTISPECIES: hypothetical protein [Flavobacterium]|uniref:DUF4377 domain-containing protein n=1 Tax=Flavobacterium hankyongi TaxID=1176532 RepID=A0ABP9A8L9_9FLAO|nr:hypothetical protein [Flavobacterium sp. N1846]
MNKVKVIQFFIITILFLCIFLGLNKCKEERRKIEFETICYVNNGNINRSSKDISGYFYFKGKRYETYEIVHDNPKKYIGKYYKIILSSKYPNDSEILYNEEVTDINKIKKVGFEHL